MPFRRSKVRSRLQALAATGAGLAVFAAGAALVWHAALGGRGGDSIIVCDFGSPGESCAAPPPDGAAPYRGPVPDLLSALRASLCRGRASLEMAREPAGESLGRNPGGRRAGLLGLVERARTLAEGSGPGFGSPPPSR